MVPERGIFVVHSDFPLAFTVTFTYAHVRACTKNQTVGIENACSWAICYQVETNRKFWCFLYMLTVEEINDKACKRNEKKHNYFEFILDLTKEFFLNFFLVT